MRCTRLLVAVSFTLGALAGFSAPAQGTKTPKQVVDAMVSHEYTAEKSLRLFLYTSEERSERTAGRLWTERVAETSVGKIKMLIAEDGQPLSADRAATERARINAIAEHPEAFEKSAASLKNDEKHAREMLNLLPKAFVLDGMRDEGGFLHINFRPDPAYAPQSMEERVIHGMSGNLMVDEHEMRLHSIEGRLPADVSIGFGLATIRAGSNFSTTRSRVLGDEWKTIAVDTDINGRVIFLKSIGKQQHAVHHDFKPLPDSITVQQAVAALLR
jgi:hypothetical protein